MQTWEMNYVERINLTQFYSNHYLIWCLKLHFKHCLLTSIYTWQLSYYGSTWLTYMILRLKCQIAIYLDILNLVVFVYVYICHSFSYRCFCHYCNLYIPFFSHIYVKYTYEISKQSSKHNSILRNICDNIFKSMTSDCWASNLSYWINNIIYKYQNKVELRQRWSQNTTWSISIL